MVTSRQYLLLQLRTLHTILHTIITDQSSKECSYATVNSTLTEVEHIVR